ncbi:MAG TPA: ankyrin repeat domain-containing protein [Candidatus Angelobacter sp.]|nr:ankyrin repeat domain-containing protein [Candidatus Angelobacter sp.]
MGKVCYLIDPEEMLQAAQRGDVDKVRQLLASDTTLVNAKGAHNKTPLHWAAEKNYPELAELLVTAGADINAEVSWGMTPLQWAANMGSRDVAKILLAHGAAPQLNMWAAAGLGMLDVVQSFWDSALPSTLKPGADQTRARDLSPQSGKSGQPGDPGLGDGKWGKAAPPESYAKLVSDAFYIAARNGHVEVAKFLLEKGADINCRGFFGAPGLHWAAIHGHKTMVEFLIGHGADLTLRDQQFNSTALGWALEGNHTEIAELLKARGVGE